MADQKATTADEPTEETPIAMAHSGSSIPATPAAAVDLVLKPLKKEAIRLKTSFRSVSLCLLGFSIVLALVWAARGSMERRSFTGQQQLTTLKGANRFTIDKLGQASERLASKSDSTLYEFLADHHDAEALQGSKQNIVREVLLAIEHESAQAGLILVVQLFSDVYAAWPKTMIGDKGKKRIKQMIDDLDRLEKVKLAADAETLSDDTNDAESPKMTTVADGLKSIQKELEDMRDFGQIDDSEDNIVKEALESQNPGALASVLRSALYVDECRPFLSRIDKVRMEDLKGKPMERKFLKGGNKQTEAEKQQSEGKKRTPAPTKLDIPSDQNLVHATKALRDLAAFVDDKPELNGIIRNMLLEDLKE